MNKQHLKQAWRTLRQNPILSMISIVATALAICMIMMMVMTERVKMSNYRPEVNRDRTLYLYRVAQRDKGGDGLSSSLMNTKLYREMAPKITTAEAFGIVKPALFFNFEPSTIMMNAKSEKHKGAVVKVNLDYWKCLDFKLLYGHFFTQEDMDSGLKKAILSEALARRVFMRPDVVGETLLYNYEPFEVIGVVATPSNMLPIAEGDMWIPYTATTDNDFNELLGDYIGIFLAKSPSDFPKIQAEVDQFVQEYNESHDHDFILELQDGGELAKWKGMQQFLTLQSPEETKTQRRTAIALLSLFILVPTINLATLTYSRQEQRISELGIRRSYGANRSAIVGEVITESLLYTLLGGLLGFILSAIAVYLLKDLLFLDLFAKDVTLSFWQLFNVATFFIALLTILVINLLSSIVPAWMMSRKSIIESLNRQQL